MNTQEVKTKSGLVGPDVLGLFTRWASARSGLRWAEVRVEQIPGQDATVEQLQNRTDDSIVSLHVSAVLFWRDEDRKVRLMPIDSPPALTWESTDDELKAAAVKILEQAEGQP